MTKTNNEFTKELGEALRALHTKFQGDAYPNIWQDTNELRHLFAELLMDMFEHGYSDDAVFEYLISERTYDDLIEQFARTDGFFDALKKIGSGQITIGDDQVFVMKYIGEREEGDESND